MFSVLGWIFLVAGIGFSVTRHAAEQGLTNTIQLWSLLGGVFMGVVSFSLSAIMGILIDIAVRLGAAEAEVEDQGSTPRGN